MSVTAHLDNFEAVSEFWHHNDTCGETAFLVNEHCRDGIALNGNDVDAVRADMAVRGYGVQGGTTMGELVDYFGKHRGLDVVYANDYGSTWDAIHQTLLDHAGRDGVVIEVELAYMLTGNEWGTHRHFVAIGAIDPVKGYLVANGDDVNALASHGGHGQVIPTRWMNKGVIEAARPSACAVIRGIPHTVEGEAPAAGPVATPPPAPAPTPAPAPVPDPCLNHENVAIFRNELRQAQQQAQQLVEALAKAIASLPQV